MDPTHLDPTLQLGQAVAVTPSVPIPWTELLRRVYAKTSEDNLFDLAAQLAYY
jgi:uncharacterized BrkB/YihY/UPF0761 family membrane protein